MKCPYCDKPLQLVDDITIYGTSYGNKKFWLCRPCWAYVGCHSGTTKALGTAANAETRMWRAKAHEVVDPLWRSGRWNRSALYRTLSKNLGWEVHMGKSTVEQCKSIIYAVSQLKIYGSGNN